MSNFGKVFIAIVLCGVLLLITGMATVFVNAIPGLVVMGAGVVLVIFLLVFTVCYFLLKRKREVVPILDHVPREFRNPYILQLASTTTAV